MSKHPEYSEAFYAKKNGKEFQIEIELVDGPNAEDPDKITVIVGDKSATVDVPKDGTEDHYRTAVAAGLKKLGYEIVLVNSNPATIMTDPDVADITYIEPLNLARLTQSIEKERPDDPRLR